MKEILHFIPLRFIAFRNRRFDVVNDREQNKNSSVVPLISAHDNVLHGKVGHASRICCIGKCKDRCALPQDFMLSQSVKTAMSNTARLMREVG